MSPPLPEEILRTKPERLTRLRPRNARETDSDRCTIPTKSPATEASAEPISRMTLINNFYPQFVTCQGEVQLAGHVSGLESAKFMPPGDVKLQTFCTRREMAVPSFPGSG